MDEVSDRLETLILMALDANHAGVAPDPLYRDRTTGMVQELVDQGELLRFSPMNPDSAFTIDMVSGNRIFGTTKDCLVEHPVEVLGDEAEIILMHENMIKWFGFRRLKRPPRGIACLGKPDFWYEFHMRYVLENGKGEYYKRLIPLSKSGEPLLAQIQKHNVCNPKVEGISLITSASVIEDAHRAGTMLAAVRDATEIKFPVPLDDYKCVFANREGPYNGARRKSIVHWVAKHLRTTPSGGSTNVKRHVRGVHEIMMDGLKITLTPNDKDA